MKQIVDKCVTVWYTALTLTKQGNQMTHAIVVIATKTVAVDAAGYAHLYSSKEVAERVFAEQFSGRTDVRVQPW